MFPSSPKCYFGFSFEIKSWSFRDLCKELHYTHNCPEKKSESATPYTNLVRSRGVGGWNGYIQDSEAPGSHPKCPAGDQPLRATGCPQGETESTNGFGQTIYKNRTLTYNLQQRAQETKPLATVTGPGRQPAVRQTWGKSDGCLYWQCRKANSNTRNNQNSQDMINSWQLPQFLSLLPT